MIAAIAAVPAHAAFGVLDPSWGGDGRVTTAVSPGGGQDGIQDIALQDDGKVVAAGYRDSDPGAGADYDFALARYNADGSLDGSFGGDGIVTTPIGGGDDDVGVASGVAIQADGKIVAAGYAAIGSPSHWEFAVVRYNANGSLDDAGGGSSFGGDGIVITPVGVPSPSSGLGYDVAVQADGKIVVAGEGDYDGATDEDFTLVRYEADGDLDAGFDGDPGNPGGGNGIVATDFSGDEGSDYANAIAIQTDGRIVAVGAALPSGPPARDFAIARYETDGTLDTDFDGPGGGNGRFTTDFGSDSEAANDVAVQGDGRIVAAGEAAIAGGFQFALARYVAATGSLDPSFDGNAGNAGGGNGKVTTDVTGGSSNDNAREVEIEAGGKIVLAGSSDVDPNPGGHFDFAVTRYSSADGTLDRSFAGDGVTTIAFPPTASDYAYGAAIQANGRIVVGGQAIEVPGAGGANFGLIRLGPEPEPGRCGGSVATVTGTAGRDTLRGTARRDVFAGLGGNDVIRGLGGRDLVCGGGGRDRLVGGPGHDRLLGQAGKDRLIGGGGRDRLLGQAGGDRLLGGGGRDKLKGGGGRDVLRGGPGRDVLRGGPGRDRQFQ